MSNADAARPLLPAGVSAEDLLDAAPEGMLALSPSGHLLYLNRRAAELTGLSGAQAVGRHFLALGVFAGAAAETLSEAMLRALRGEPAGRLELEVARPDQSRLTVDLWAEALRKEGALAGVQVRLSDATERKRLEEQLRLSQRLEAVGRLATGLAHDFNNVLTVVKGYSEVMLMNPRQPPNVVKQLRSMAAACERGANLSRQLLTFSRRRTVEQKALDLNEALSSVTQMLRRLVGENVTLQFRFTPSLPAIQADLGMLEQAISNLVLHARESMPAGGPLMIETGLSEFDEAAAQQRPERRSGKFLCLSISDSGPGLDAARLARLFEPPPGHDPEAPPRLGLHIANVVVKQAHGWIEAQSELGKGTTFRVYWPAAAQEAEAIEGTAPPEPARGGAERILVVEDEPSIRELAKAVLSGYGYDVCDAGTGDEALAVWAKEGGRFDLLFTDMVMPGQLTGRMLAERLEAQKPGLKVLYTTGYSLDLVQSNIALKPGFNLLPKPYSSVSLAQAVRRTLDRAG